MGRTHRFIYNSDSGNMFEHNDPPMRATDLAPYLDEIAGTGVTTLYASPNAGMKMNFPSKVTEMLTFDSSTESSTHARLAANLSALLAEGHDPFGLVIELARKRGLEVFASFRLNEVHAVEQVDSPIVSRFWREHPEWRIGVPGDPLPELHREILGPRVNPIVGSWLPGALNFSVPEVRDLRLEELREVCERYPIDGLDLDFQRFPIYFPFGSESNYLGLMNEWMRDVRHMTRDASKDAGHPILLSARIMARPEQNIALGLDPAMWAENGLVDFVIVSHYLRNDFPLPIDEYRKILPEEMPLYASIEYEPDPEEYRRIAGQLWAAGVDGIMLFNFFASREGGRKPPFELLDELGSPEKLGGQRGG